MLTTPLRAHTFLQPQDQGLTSSGTSRKRGSLDIGMLQNSTLVARLCPTLHADVTVANTDTWG